MFRLKDHFQQRQERDVTTVVMGPLVPDFNTWKIPQLKELCKNRGLPTSGTKAVLIQRSVESYYFYFLTILLCIIVIDYVSN